MVRQRYVVQRAHGIRFVFRYEPETDLLHIYVRHLATPEDAIKAFISGHPARTTWNATRRRFQTVGDTHLLTWFWLEEGRALMVITCMSL